MTKDEIRERLVELLKTNACPSPFMCDPTCRYYGYGDCFPDRFADHLIAHGATFAETDGCNYCKEDRDGYLRMFGAFELRNPFHQGKWYIATGHCKARRIYFCPMCGRQLSEPPKEVEQ